MSTLPTDHPRELRTFRVSGLVRFADGIPATGTKVVAFDLDLRSEQPLGEAYTDRDGAYRIEYSQSQFLNLERGTADLVVKDIDADGSIRVASRVLFNAPQDAIIDLTIPLDRQFPPTLFERIASAVEPLLGRMTVEELEEDQEHQDLTFLSGETGFERRALAGFVLAHGLARLGIDREFWFALLGGSFFELAEKESLKENLAAVSDALPALDATAVRKALASSFNRREIPARLRERTDAWTAAFLELVASLVLGNAKSPTFVRMALDDAGIDSKDKQAVFARLFNRHRALTPELLTALEKDGAFKKEEIADLCTSYQLADLTKADFSVVKMLKEEFHVRQPEQIRTLAKRSERQWVELIERKHQAGDIKLPFGLTQPAADVRLPEAEIYAKTLERQLREAFPTAAFAGGLERALGNGGTHGVRSAETLGRIIERHPEFDLLRTSIDEFLSKDIRSEFQALAKEETFRLELKAVQRVFKLTPTFEATDAVLADGLHSAQMIYRLGESEFVRRYADRAGFSAESARMAWNRAADTHAAVLTVIGDLASFDSGVLPGVLKSSHPDLKTFPNWDNLFWSGDICHCEQCRSVLGPAAYFTDILMFVRDRRAVNPAFSVKDILFKRRPDLGYLELNCENALTTLPYVDIVCEVLEQAVDAAGDNDFVLTGLNAIPAAVAARKGAVAAALTAALTDPANAGKETTAVGNDFSLLQVDPAAPDRWLVHGDDATYLLKKKAVADFFAEIIPNTKASSEELRAYPAYVNPKAYSKLRQARFPLALPFDLFAEEVRAAFQKSNLQRWDLMRTFRAPVAPNDPTDGEIAAEYFNISCDSAAAFDERRLILVADVTVVGQQEVWGEKGNAGWLAVRGYPPPAPVTIANVKTFLQKSGIEYDELLALLDLAFINPSGDIIIQHLDASCDTDKKVIQGLNAAKLDRIHRFLRMWRKLNGWKMLELDLAIRCKGIGKGTLDEPFLINLFHFGRLKSRLGAKTTVAQLCGLFDILSVETPFTHLHEKRAEGLYQSLFQNKKLIQPLDSAFEVAAVNVAGPTAEKISGHRAVILSALGVRETDLDLFAGLVRASNGAPYITDDLTLGNLSFLWRHVWLSKLLKFKADEWKIVLNLLQQDVSSFPDPKVALEFVEKSDHLRATDFTPDELNWLLAADCLAKAAVKEADAARFLKTLRTELQAIRAEYDTARYEFLDPPSDLGRLTALLTTLLPQLNRDEVGAQSFVETIRDEIKQEKLVPGLPAGFTFPAAITGLPNNIRIHYEPVLQFAGVMTAAQGTVLLTDPSLVAVTGLPSYKQAIQDLLEKPGSASVNDLPPGFSFPATITGAPNSIPIRYDPVMRFTGLMTVTQHLTLKGNLSLAAVTGIAAYQQAIEEFFQSPRLALKFLDPVFTAPLANLPTAVDFKMLTDAALALKISFNAEERALRVIGILSADDKSALDALSANLGYRNAVNSLFTQPRFGGFGPEKLWLQDADLNFPLRDPNRDPNDPASSEDVANLKDNLATAAKKGLAYLSKALSEGQVVRQAGTQIGLTEGLTRRLLTDYAILPDSLLVHLTGAFAVTSGVVDYATLKNTFDGWYWAARIAVLWKKWKLTLAEWERIRDLTTSAQLVDFTALPLDAAAAMVPIERVLRTSRLFRFKESLPETGSTLFEVLIKLSDGKYIAADFSDFANDVELMNDAWSADNAKAIVGSFDLAYPKEYLLAQSWERISRAFSFVESLNAGVTTVSALAAATMADSHAKTLKALLRSKLGGDTWLTLSTEIQDALRERKRDALAAYLLTQPMPADAPSGKWENTNDLYAHYLLDVEMGACQLTSRLVQASGSVQLFVQRCFMGLERDVKVQADGTNGDSAWRWWKWMCKYRVWEANRKIFLWPENWIEPELKKDRSSFFKDLENELKQNEVNQSTVETAFANYLEKLDGVAQLEIAGFYQEDDGDNTIIHVFGRTYGREPHIYYYRQYDYRQWTPWEKVDLDIQGDYLIPAVVNKQLFLFWPIFTEVPDEVANSQVVVPNAVGGSTVRKADPTTGDQRIDSPPEKTVDTQKAKKQLRLQMAVSDYRRGKWTPKRVSTDFDVTGAKHDVELNKTHYQFFAIDGALRDGSFIVDHRGHSIANNGRITDKSGDLLGALFGAFDVSGCKGVPVLRDKTYLEDDFAHVIRPERIATSRDRAMPGSGPMTYDTVSSRWLEDPQRWDRQNDFTLENQFSMGAPAPATTLEVADPLHFSPILLQTPDLFAVAAPWHLSLFDQWLLDANVTSRVPSYGTGRLFGTWLPFFYKDKVRSFFVLPSLGGLPQGREAPSAAGIRLYYPEMKSSLRQWEAYFEGLVQTWLDSVNLSSLTAAQRKQLEEDLHQQFPEVALPPYPDDQVKVLWKRSFMRFHHLTVGGWALWWFQWRQFHFKTFYHPFVCDFAKLLNNPLKGIPALMSRETQLKDSGFSFLRTYQPTPWVVEPLTEAFYPRETVDFSPDGAYSSYNWELFFHAPLLIANALSRNQRFEEARDWYHFIFNPIGVEAPAPGGSAVSKYWITKPFFETTDPQYVKQRIENILRMVAGDTTVPGYSALAKKALENQVFDWRTNPFEPHRIANYRTVAYQKTVVMKYLDNLISWGDNLFRQDSMESINEATQLYVLAAELLGQRPKKIPPQVKPPIESFNELEKQLDAFANALVEVENLIPPSSGTGVAAADSAPLPMLYFCIPPNEKMLGYWDTVADRLYKIRHCMNIEGVVRQLALFEPPIDPGALVKAVAAGLDIGAALADLNAPLPLYRFNVLLQKANEVCNDVKALGGALLSALEKKDGEALSLLRQGQEIRVLEAVKTVREKQIEEAKENLQAAKRSRSTVETRRNYYRDIERIIDQEQLHLEKLGKSLTLQEAAQGAKLGASIVSLLPAIDLGVSGFGGSPIAKFKIGGLELGQAANLASEVLGVLAQIAANDAAMASSTGGFDRRWNDWKLQERLADQELDQLDRQIAASELRVAIAEEELENHIKQVENAKAIDAFMRSKYTNEELYQWQVSQISGVYFQSYKLAYDLAKRAVRCFCFELGLQDSSIISFGYWDSLKKGLLSGERLQYDLRRLEAAYLEQNRREFELTKHISLVQLDPLALVRLRETGRCFFRLPEEIFDLDYAGHYFRRIKTVSLTLPCVAGPYTTISCTLRLLKNSIRSNTTNGDNGYPRNTDGADLPADDSRFSESNIPVKAIAASSGQNDSGVFELSFRDERYLPFEGAGVISEWSLELFSDSVSPDFGLPLRQFDYNTIIDTVLHIKYTAREDAGVFKNGAIKHLREYFSHDEAMPSHLMLDLRRDFGAQWVRFLKPTNPVNGNVFELEISAHLFPTRDAGKTLKVNTVYLLARCTDGGNYGVTLTPPLPAPPPAGSNTMTLVKSKHYGGLHFGQKDIAAAGIKMVPTDPPASWSIRMTHPGGLNLTEDPVKKVMEVEDVILVIRYEWE
jgi:Tc toxin complex TcA C-terminal TcB-binding domain/Neuraminidase-like domain